MRTDTYTKIVLTTIALATLWMALATPGRAVQAQQGLTLSAQPQPVVIVGWGTFDSAGRVTVTMRGDRPGGSSDPNIPVRLIGEARLQYSDANPLPISITQIKPAGEWEPIRSSVEEEPVRAKPGRRDR